jgi:hypothetical protein
MPRAMRERVRDLESAKVPTTALLHALAEAVAQYLANATGGRVEIGMHGRVVISRSPAGAKHTKKQ